MRRPSAKKRRTGHPARRKGGVGKQPQVVFTVNRYFRGPSSRNTSMKRISAFACVPGVLRGNYYNAVADSTEPVSGSGDRKTQRAAWTVGSRKAPVFET